MEKQHGSESRHFPVTTVFKQDPQKSERNQVTYRIPALIYNAENQTFLAFAEKRKSTDDTDADVLVMRRGIWRDGTVEVRLSTLIFSLYCYTAFWNFVSLILLGL